MGLKAINWGVSETGVGEGNPQKNLFTVVLSQQLVFLLILCPYLASFHVELLLLNYMPLLPLSQ